MNKVKNMFRLMVLALLVGGWAVAASALHVVWTGEKLSVMSKDHLGVRDTYVDTSAWTANDVAAHPIVVKRLIETGKADVLSKAFEMKTGEQLVREIEDAIEKGPTTQPTPTVNDKVADHVHQVAEKAEEVAAKAKQAADQVKGAVQ